MDSLLYKTLTAAVDAARADLWETNDIPNMVSNYDAAHAKESARAELWTQLIRWREGDPSLTYPELFQFCASFDANLTPEDFDQFLETL